MTRQQQLKGPGEFSCCLFTCFQFFFIFYFILIIYFGARDSKGENNTAQTVGEASWSRLILGSGSLGMQLLTSWQDPKQGQAITHSAHPKRHDVHQPDLPKAPQHLNNATSWAPSVPTHQALGHILFKSKLEKSQSSLFEDDI